MFTTAPRVVRVAARGVSALVAAIVASVLVPVVAFASNNYPPTVPSGTKTTIVPQVLPTKVAEQSQAVLAYTGANSWPIIGLALVLIIVGIVAFRGSRKVSSKH